MEDDFRTWEPLSGDRYAALGSPATLLGGYAEGESPPPRHEFDYLSVYVLRVVVEIDDGPGWVDLDAAEEDDLKELFERAEDATCAARDAAREVIEDLVAWARADSDQYWLGLSSDVPESVGPTRVVEVETNQDLPFAPTVALHSGGLRCDDRALHVHDISRLFESVVRREPAPLAESFLADAEYLAWGHFPHDPVRAVLMAAIAAEVKVKMDLVARAQTDQRELVDFALENQREVTVTAVNGLFDKLMKAAQGRSLREDDPKLFKRLGELFRLRNRIAHRGEAPDLAAAQDGVRAAREAIVWVEGYRGSSCECPE